MPWKHYRFAPGEEEERVLIDKYYLADIPYVIIIAKDGTVVDMLRFPSKTLEDTLKKILKL